jgi:hypothetical protein
MKKVLWTVLALGWAGAAWASSLSVDFTFSDRDVELFPAGDYQVVGLAGGMKVMDEAGAPSIPAKFVNVLVPAGAENISISAEGDLELLAEGVLPYPAQPRQPKSRARAAFVPANDRYGSAEAWPADVATFQGDHDMQGYRFVSVRLNPLAFVGAEEALYLRRTITVTVSYDLGPAPRAITSKQKSLFAPLVDSLVANPAAGDEYAPKTRTAEPKAAVDYLIITSAALSNAFQQIASYRASGAGGSYTVRVMTTNDIASTYAGTDLPAKIRACISNHVAAQGTTMVLLGGDDTVVPVRACKVSAEGDTELQMPTDLYYSGLGGSWNADGDSIYGETTDAVDMAWDVVVGRLPMRTAAQVTNYLNRVMTYESGSPVADKLILGGPEAWDTYSGSGRPSDDVTIDGHPGFRSTSPAHNTVSDSEAWLRRLYRDGIRSNWPATVGIMCDTLTSWDSSSCGDHLQSSANTIAAFNRNWTHLMFSGHGEPQAWGLESGSFTQSGAAGMTGMTAFVYTDACLTGHFDKNSNSIDGYSYTTEPCLAEGFLRNARVRGGALAYMGCARYGWGEPDPSPADNTANGGPSTVYAYKFYKRMYETPGRTLGVAFAMHKADMASVSASDGCERWIQFGMNLLGDPAIKMPVASVVSVAPSFNALGVQTAVVGVVKILAVSATGTPSPVLALTGTTASSGYSFTAGSGQLSYTPPAADIGSRTFTFTASNSAGVATQTVSVTVNDGPPAAPSPVWAGATNETSFTAAWEAVASATGYRLDVGTNATFTGGGGGAAVPGTNAYHNGTLGEGTGGTWTETGLTQGSGGYLISLTGDALATPAMDFNAGTAETLNFKARTYGGVNAANNVITVSVSTDNGGTWSVLGTRTPLTTTLTAMTPFDLSGTSGTQVKVKLETLGATASVGAGIDDVLVTNLAGSASAFYVPGYSNRTVASTSQAVTGLVSGATYHFRVRAVSTGGTSVNSAVASVTTVNNTPFAPVFGANPGPVTAIVGAAKNFTVSAAGLPAPTLALRGTTASSGYSFTPGTGVLAYTPPGADEGARTFTFTASNSLGVATQVVAVTVTAAGAGGGMETFDHFPPSGTTYATGTFEGQDGSTWTHSLTRGDLLINGKTPTIRNAAGAYIQSGTIAGGVGSLTFQYRKPFSTDTAMGTLVYVIGQDHVFTGQVTVVPSATNEVLTFSVADVNVPGNFVLLLTNKSTTARIGIDDITWTGYSGGGATGTRPALEPLGARNVMVGKTLSCTVAATEPDGDAITFACASAVDPARWSLNTGSGAFSFSPSSAEAGAVQFTFTAADKDGTSTPVAMNVTVCEPQAVSGFTAPTNGAAASMTMGSQEGVTYALEYTTDLRGDPPAWWPVDQEAGTGSEITLQDENPADAQRYYRVVIP